MYNNFKLVVIIFRYPQPSLKGSVVNENNFHINLIFNDTGHAKRVPVFI